MPRLLQDATNTGQPYRLAVIDSRMPVLAGTDLTHIIRTDPSTRELPVLMLTSSGSGRTAATEAGVDGFITKPVHQTRLFREIAQHLGRRRPKTPTPVSDAPPAARIRQPGDAPANPGQRHLAPRR